MRNSPSWDKHVAPRPWIRCSVLLAAMEGAMADTNPVISIQTSSEAAGMQSVRTWVGFFLWAGGLEKWPLSSGPWDEKLCQSSTHWLRYIQGQTGTKWRKGLGLRNTGVWWGVWPTETVALTHRHLCRWCRWGFVGRAYQRCPALYVTHCLGLTVSHHLPSSWSHLTTWHDGGWTSGFQAEFCDIPSMAAGRDEGVMQRVLWPQPFYLSILLIIFFQSQVIIINYPVHLLLILFISFFLQNECIISGSPELDDEEFTPEILVKWRNTWMMSEYILLFQ